MLYLTYGNAREKGGDKVFDKRKFKAAVILKGMTFKEVAKKLGINEATLQRKMNGESDFYRNEIQSLCEILDLDDPTDIFFSAKLTETQERR